MRRVAIVLPTHNRAALLRSALRSLVAQMYRRDYQVFGYQLPT